MRENISQYEKEVDVSAFNPPPENKLDYAQEEFGYVFHGSLTVCCIRNTCLKGGRFNTQMPA